MLDARTVLFVTLVALLLSACRTMGLHGESSQSGHAEHDLEQAVKIYEDGDYATAMVILRHAQQNRLRSKYDQARAYKYLAFIHCISAREKQCRDAFKKALEIDPTFNLQPAEEGHPVWGPVFRSVQGSRPAK